MSSDGNLAIDSHPGRGWIGLSCGALPKVRRFIVRVILFCRVLHERTSLFYSSAGATRPMFGIPRKWDDTLFISCHSELVNTNDVPVVEPRACFC